jgi:hypothetical protein
LVNDRAATEERGQQISAEAVGGLVAFLDSSGLDRRRYRVVHRLRGIADSDEFATLPEDLRERVSEILAETKN